MGGENQAQGCSKSSQWKKGWIGEPNGVQGRGKDQTMLLWADDTGYTTKNHVFKGV